MCPFIPDLPQRPPERYFGILYQGNIRKWICRLRLTPSQKTLIIPDENKKETKYVLEDIYDIMNYKEQLSNVLNRYL